MNTEHLNPPPPPKNASRWVKFLLWTVAFLLMVAAASYQRRTGPTRPFRGTVEVDGAVVRYKLIRTALSCEENVSARVVIPYPLAVSDPPALTGTLRYRRYRTDDPFTEVEMSKETVDDDSALVGLLPAQPSAGKLEYSIELARGAAGVRIPESADEMIVIRFKDHVPIAVLLPHILLMFFAMLFGLRAGIGALFDPGGNRFHVRAAFAGMTVGGMILGPIVQKYAFGAYWTGFPLGGDWTDNKMLVMWLVWVIAFIVVGIRTGKRPQLDRAVVILAALVMIAVYLIPHSTRGSELDYSKVDAGVDPADAIETG
jgi:hypothetical protein